MGAKNGRSKRQRQGRPTRGSSPIPRTVVAPDADTATRVLALVHDAARALDAGDVHQLDERVLDLVVLAQTDDPRAVDAALAARVDDALADRWRGGWSPSDLRQVVPQARLHPGADSRTLARVAEALDDAVAHALAAFEPGTVDPTWSPQPGSPRPDRVPARVSRWGAASAYEVVVRLDRALRGLPVLQPLGPLPGEAVPDPASAGAGAREVDERVLERVRRLLAKAESTPFEAEAETFTAGAQALMSRHSIDRALLAGVAGEQPRGRRLWLEEPYVREKVLLLAAVADANRARTVWSREEGHVTVLGFAADVDAVTVVYTSLLVQATRAMHAEGRRAEATRDFRASFLAAFATRVGERLDDVSARVTRDAQAGASPGTDLVRVLDGRVREVEAWAERTFGELQPVTMTLAGDPEGWAKGRRAAQAADLGHPGRPRVEEHPAGPRAREGR